MKVGIYIIIIIIIIIIYMYIYTTKLFKPQPIPVLKTRHIH